MFSVDAHTCVYVAAQPVDFRRQIDGLALLVQDTLQLNPFTSHLFVFRNRHADKLKLLYWHQNGYVLLYKRLEKGRFIWPVNPSQSTLCISLRELHALFDGTDIDQLPQVRQLHYQRV